MHIVSSKLLFYLSICRIPYAKCLSLVWKKNRCRANPRLPPPVAKCGRAAPPQSPGVDLCASRSRWRPPLRRACRGRHANPAGDLAAGHTGGIQPKHVAHPAHRDPLCWHRPLPWQKLEGTDAKRSAERSSNRATSSRNCGRHHPGTSSEIKSEWWARSSRNAGRLPSESGGFCEVARRRT